VRRIERRVGSPRGCGGVVSDRVLIVGGGIAGLSLARALGRRDIAFVVVDRLGGAPDAGLALNLPGNAVRALLALDLGDDIVGRGVPIRRREYRNARGRLLDEAAFWGDAVTGLICSSCWALALRQGRSAGTRRSSIWRKRGTRSRCDSTMAGQRATT
jgi:glycine/D-amino acid oxidase-like deaminating enzyme